MSPSERTAVIFHADDSATVVDLLRMNALIVEAKREGNDFEIPSGKSGLNYSIKASMADYRQSG